MAAKPGDYVPALRYRWLTPYYDFFVGLTTRERTFKAALIAQAGIEAGHRVLDLACGTGTLSVWIKQAAPDAEVHAIDADPEILAIAMRKGVRAGVAVNFEPAMSHELPFPDGNFDRVVSSLFLHHLGPADKARTAGEVCRVLRPGGQFHVADWGKAANPAMRALFLPVQMLDGFDNTRDNVRGKLPGIFSAAGFAEVLERRTFQTPLGTLALYSAVRPPG